MNYICMVVDGNYPNDIRVRKQAESLTQKGKKVLVVCPLKKGLLVKENINGVEIHRIGKNYTANKKAIHDIIESVFNINLFFYYGLKKIFMEYKMDFLHIHDLPLASTGYRFKKKVSKKLILDLHENFPEAIKTWFMWRKNFFIRFKNNVFMNPHKWSRKEGKYCNKYDIVICVVAEMKEKLISKFNINSNKLVVISNHEKKSFIHNFNKEKKSTVIKKDVFSITYVGGFGPHRGLDIAIKAMVKIVEKISNAQLFLIGKGSFDVENKLFKIAKEKGVIENVHFGGYIPFKEVSKVMEISNINIIPHKSNDHTNNTIPHKLFQIMMSKSYLLVSSCIPLKRIVEKYDAGFVFKSDDVKDFENKVIDIYTNYDSYKLKKENAFNAVVHGKENWENESSKLINMYETLN